VCPAGQYTMRESGAIAKDTGCVECPKGTFSAGGKVTACTDKTCKVNTYSDKTGATKTDENCKDCASGAVSTGGAA